MSFDPEYTINYLQAVGGVTGTSIGGTSHEFKRDDFKRVDTKGGGQHYYHSHHDVIENIEICLEPCLNGFDVALYKNENLIDQKRCTDLKASIFKRNLEEAKPSDEKTLKLEMHGTQERSQVCWDSALKIANEMFRGYKNKRRIERMGLKKKTFPDLDDMEPDYDADALRRWSEAQDKMNPVYDTTAGSTAADPNKHFINEIQKLQAKADSLTAEREELKAQKSKMPDAGPPVYPIGDPNKP